MTNNDKSIGERVLKIALAVFSFLVLFFLFLPILVVIPMSFSSASALEFPPPGFSFRWYQALFSDKNWMEAMRNSFIIAAVSSTLALILGALAAYGLVRSGNRFVGILESNFIAPLIVPPVVTGVALYIVFGYVGLLGTFGGLIIGHTVLAVPYVILVMVVAVRAFDYRIEQVAYSMGASWVTIARRIMLPNILPSLLAAWLFAFITSFDEVIVTWFVSGAIPTIPKKMFNELIIEINPTITAIASLLIIFSTIGVWIFATLMNRKE